jgi:hypothetical protein
MAMRGDDFIGAGYGADDDKLWLLRGEVKSSKVLGKTTITKARKVLNRDDGRWTLINFDLSCEEHMHSLPTFMTSKKVGF